MFVASGAPTDSWTMTSSREETYEKYRKEYPKIVLAVFGKDESIRVKEGAKLMTRFQRHLETILGGAYFVAEWQRKRIAKRKKKKQRAMRFPGASSVPTTLTFVDAGKPSQISSVGNNSESEPDFSGSSSEDSDASDGGARPIHPLSYNTFWKIVKKSKVRFKRVKTPYSCETHEKAPGIRRRKAEVEDLLASAKFNAPAEFTAERAALSEELSSLTKKVAAIEIHERQFENQRRFIQDKEQDLLNYPHSVSGGNKIIVYEDFADFYNADGKKILNLVFTIVWCNANGLLQRKYIDNLNSDHIRAHNKEWKEKYGKFSSNAMFVKRVWEFLLRPNEILQQLKNEALSEPEKVKLLAEFAKLANECGNEFEGVSDILRTGDSGGHFHNRVNAVFESSAFKRYGIKWETHTLCKRHAYSLCDAHGGAGKRAFRHSAAIGELPKEAADFARAIMHHAKFGDTRAIAYTNMDMSTAEQEYAALSEMAGMKKACEFQYFYVDDSGEKVYTSGFSRFRTVSGDESAPWTAVHLPKVEEGKESKKVCAKCTQGRQRPVWHEKSAGNCKVQWEKVGDNKVLMPALRGAEGEQMEMGTMRVVDMCEWARLEGMGHLVDAIRNTVLDGVRLKVSMSSHEQSEVLELFTQMGLVDSSKQAAFLAKLVKLQAEGWIRPSTKQVASKIINAPKEKEPRKRKEPKVEPPPTAKKRKTIKSVGVDNHVDVPELLPQAAASVSASQQKKPRKSKNKEPDEIVLESLTQTTQQVQVAAPRSLRNRKKINYEESQLSSDEEKPLKKKVPLESHFVLNQVPLSDYELQCVQKRAQRAAEELALKASVIDSVCELDIILKLGDTLPNSATKSNDDEYVPSDQRDSSSYDESDDEPLKSSTTAAATISTIIIAAASTASTTTTTATTTTSTTTTASLDIPDVMCNSNRCVFNQIKCEPATSSVLHDSNTVERSAINHRSTLPISSIVPLPDGSLK